MDVLVNEQDLADDVKLGGDLTAKFVRTWRKKTKDGEECWYRRSAWLHVSSTGCVLGMICIPLHPIT